MTMAAGVAAAAAAAAAVAMPFLLPQGHSLGDICGIAASAAVGEVVLHIDTGRVGGMPVGAWACTTDGTLAAQAALPVELAAGAATSVAAAVESVGAVSQLPVPDRREEASLVPK